MDVKHHAIAIDIPDLKVDSFLKPKAAGVCGPEERLVVQAVGGADDSADLFDFEDDGESDFLAGAHQAVSDNSILEQPGSLQGTRSVSLAPNTAGLVPPFQLSARAQGEGAPLALQREGEEELHAAVGDLHGTGGKGVLVLEVQEVLAEFLLADLARRLVHVFAQLPDRSEGTSPACARRNL